MQKLLFRTTLSQGSPLKRLRSGQGRARGLPEGAVPFHVPSDHRTGTWGPCTIDLGSCACTGGECRAALAVGAALPAGFRPPDDLPHFLARHGATAPHRTPGVARPSPRRLLTYGNFHGHFHCSGIIGNYHALSVVTGESGGHTGGVSGGVNIHLSSLQ